ncbi:MAG: glycosyltransferase [Gemmatimonadaceae bacterium]
MHTARKKIVVLGMMSRHPVAGMIWLTVQYLIGLRRMGYDVWYVEPQGGAPGQNSSVEAEWLERVLRRFDLADRWAYDAVHGDGQCYGMSDTALRELIRSAHWIFNLHGSTKPTEELSRPGRLVYIGTDPVEVEISLWEGDARSSSFLSPHCAFFTWGENLGNPDCRVPVPKDFDFKPTRQPSVIDLWDDESRIRGDLFTTIGNWKQPYREVEFEGETYYWSKHHEFLKFIDLPARTSQRFELALSSFDEDDRRLLERNGWRVTEAARFGDNPDLYRDYILGSRGEFTVSKEQYYRLKSGWFSDRSTSYLSAGRPVINQESGFSNIFPTGAGLFAFSTMDELVSAVEAINSDYARHSRAARDLAREYFSYEVVLGRMLFELGDR